MANRETARFGPAIRHRPLPFLYRSVNVQHTINIGVRFYLPAYPFLLIISGARLARLSSLRAPKRLGIAVVSAVLISGAVETLRTYPNELITFSSVPTLLEQNQLFEEIV